jgi:hypothetical protein
MKIELTIRHRDGSDILMPDLTLYRFAPDDQGRHVCVIENDDHIEHLLGLGHFAELADAGTPTGGAAKNEGGEGGEGENAPPPADLSALSIEELRVEFSRATGEVPHPRLGAPKMIERINQAVAAAAAAAAAAETNA